LRVGSAGFGVGLAGAGSALAVNCIDALLAGHTQAERSKTLTNALLDLQRLPHSKRAAGGFAVALVSVIEQGLHHA